MPRCASPSLTWSMTLGKNRTCRSPSNWRPSARLSPWMPATPRLPLAFFTFTLQNLAFEDLDVSLLAGLRNLTGYTYSEQPSRMAFRQDEQAAMIQLSREKCARRRFG